MALEAAELLLAALFCLGVGCGRRVAILYGLGKYFLCRHCYDLRYESKREDKKGRALRRVQKIRGAGCPR